MCTICAIAHYLEVWCYQSLVEISKGFMVHDLMRRLSAFTTDVRSSVLLQGVDNAKRW